MNNRSELKHPTDKLRLAWGKDHAVGWFVQVWDTTEYAEPDGDNIIIDQDAMFSGLTFDGIVAVAQKYGFKTEEITG